MLPSIHLLQWRVTGADFSYFTFNSGRHNESAVASIYRSEDLKEAFVNSLNVSLANANEETHVVLAA
ncbi:hypothetical protein OIU85_001305 [Salix viminalis]|uniref:Uncharacterized protein n=1 Tax=Salix viminalis TaxID=40686 RepID=A0A9Q0VL03_SALVM|nr:hypothetical protein OIU85_001305 [Salix viminalis]